MFVFVDQIVGLEPGKRARGRLVLSDGRPSITPFLMSEAVGQLAGWTAMSAVDFERRPVAGLAGHVRIHHPPPPGSILDLEVELRSVDEGGVAYDGKASANDATVIELRRCVGPMLPVAEFENPERLRGRFDELRACALPEPFPAREQIRGPRALRTGGEPGRLYVSEFVVPDAAAYYEDHFPRKAVLPGTLFLDTLVEGALVVAGELPVRPRSPSAVRNVKFRSFVVPGERVTCEARLESADGSSAELTVAGFRDGKRIASARVDVPLGTER